MSIRRNLQSVAEVARKNLACSRNRYSKSDSLQNNSWVPLAPGQSVWLHRPKNWKFGGDGLDHTKSSVTKGSL